MNVFEGLCKELKKQYGTPKGQWKLWCKRPKTKRDRERVIIGAILTQRTNWKNVELALGNLKKAKINSLSDIYKLGAAKLAPFIRPSGFYKTKAQYLFNLARFVIKNYGGIGEWLAAARHTTGGAKLEKLREELLELKGIGPETADSILLYALDRPIFVIDEYTRRLVRKRGLARDLSYGALQKLFEENLRKDFRLYQDFHALVVINGKEARQGK